MSIINFKEIIKKAVNELLPGYTEHCTDMGEYGIETGNIWSYINI
jgi:hypothetical protein